MDSFSAVFRLVDKVSGTFGTVEMDGEDGTVVMVCLHDGGIVFKEQLI